SLIKYNNAYPISVDFMKVEVALRNGYDVVIGETANRTIQVIGYATSNQSSNNPADLFFSDVLRHGSINFVISEHLQLNYNNIVVILLIYFLVTYYDIDLLILSFQNIYN